MPKEDPNFEWRIVCDIRCGLDMPLNSFKPSKMPSMYVEIAWSEGLLPESIVPQTRITSIVSEDERHPNWNQ